ncbi:MAG TPA: nucleoside recognition protein [Candidatus Merdenecus merdavium]|nr:nucleoside recognition protein [Candidatus Merdenecus merdavium]
MLNYLWGFMMIAGILWGAFTGNLGAVIEGALSSAGEAITLCITMLGVMSLWSGIMEIGEKSGLIKSMTKRMGPFLSFMFPDVPKGHKAREEISTNMIANILGLGWAATPAGLKAMKSLEELNTTPGVASNAMCNFLILNISSLQILPINMIAYRSQYGSVNPASIIGPAILATLFSTIVAIAFAKIMSGRKKL